MTRFASTPRLCAAAALGAAAALALAFGLQVAPQSELAALYVEAADIQAEDAAYEADVSAELEALETLAE